MLENKKQFIENPGESYVCRDFLTQSRNIAFGLIIRKAQSERLRKGKEIRV